jgi:hypothetical protein
MSVIEIEDELGVKLSRNVDGEKRITSEQLQQLGNPEIQEQYREAYRLQQVRLSCPGCGEYGMSF